MIRNMHITIFAVSAGTKPLLAGRQHIFARAHRIDVLNPDGELPETLLRQGEYFASRGLVSRILPQRDVHVLEAEHCQVLLLVQRKQGPRPPGRTSSSAQGPRLPESWH